MDPLTPAGLCLAPGRSLCFMSLDFRPFRLQPPGCSADRFRALPLSVDGFLRERLPTTRCRQPPLGVLGFAIRGQARQTTRPNRVHLRCGLAIRLPVLPTPPRGDAVPVDYRPENVCLKRTFTSPSNHTRRRTLPSLRDPDAGASGLPSRQNRDHVFQLADRILVACAQTSVAVLKHARHAQHA